jgi:membrane-associated phospholipid phosphatase
MKKWRSSTLNWWFWVPTLLYFIVGLILAIQIPHGDEILLINGLRKFPLNDLFKAITYLGEAYAIVGIALLALTMRQYQVFGLIVSLGLLLIPVSYFTKDFMAELRPLTLLQEQGRWEQVVTVPGVELASGKTSFPSGHTMTAFALYSVLALLLPFRYRKWAVFFALLAILVGLSRVFLVQHFLVDILAGAAIGLCLSNGLWYVWGRFFSRPHFFI